MNRTAEQIQREYYTNTASQYDDMHSARDLSCEDSEHYPSLTFIDLLSGKYNLGTFLDVGAGTGRGVRFLADRGKQVRGVEPVTALIDEAEKQGVPKGLIVEGSGYSLPFPDKSFDAVFECGVLHHVAKPELVVGEMIRVAKKAVFLSDANRFGQGRYMARLLKLFLCKTHLWGAARYVQTRGKMYHISEGDGLGYSYSVFDSYRQLAEWADTVLPIPTSPVDRRLVGSWFHPLLTSPALLLCAVREEKGRDTATLVASSAQ